MLEFGDGSCASYEAGVPPQNTWDQFPALLTNCKFSMLHLGGTKQVMAQVTGFVSPKQET